MHPHIAMYASRTNTRHTERPRAITWGAFYSLYMVDCSASTSRCTPVRATVCAPRLASAVASHENTRERGIIQAMIVILIEL